MQNIAVTFQNSLVLHKKYGYIPFLGPLAKIQKDVLKNVKVILKEREELDEINALVSYAKTHTDYYKNNATDYPPIDNQSDIKKFPILLKSTLKKNLARFYSYEANGRDALVLSTSGTTGSPMKVKVCKTDLQRRYKIVLVTMLKYGFDLTRPYARFVGHDIFCKNSFTRKDILNNHYFLCIFSLNEKTVKDYCHALSVNKIEILEGYPSVIYLFAKLIERQGLAINPLRLICVTAEKLHLYQRETIERVFGCPVFDYYGSNEQSLYIYTCQEGKYHLSNETGFLEILDDFDVDVLPGEKGRMVVTSFTSRYTPLIRYDIGDACILSKTKECRCGVGGIIIDEILGRDEDVFKTLGGRYVTRFSLVLKYLPSEVLESQIILQKDNPKIDLLYTADSPISSNRFYAFEEKLNSVVGLGYNIRYEHVEEIPISNKGKKRAVLIQ
jgi:phenylacetate-CoA ligase